MTSGNSRRGTVLICVLACLGIVVALVVTTMQSSLRGRREVRMQRQLLQTELLCEAGALRAQQQLKKSATYDGETWKPKLEIQSFQYAAIEIRITKASNVAEDSHVKVVATLASSEDSNDRMQRSHTFTFPSKALTASTLPNPDYSN